MPRLFGTDGVRGVAGSELTEEFARSLGRAAVLALEHHAEGHPSFVIGRDTRASGEQLERALVDGISSAGGKALLAGVQTTPAIAFLTVELGSTSGVVISASHNPAEYNGIKFFGPNGMKLADPVEDEIESLLGLQEGDAAVEPRSEPEPIEDSDRRYVDHLAAAAEAPLDGIRLIVDCANGAACSEGQEALRRLGARVEAIFDRPDGMNINDGCGALHPEVVARAVVERGANAGVAFDGDADRALFSDASGNVIDGDQVLAGLAVAMKDERRLSGDTIVTTVMANLGLTRAMEGLGIKVLTTAVGDRYVLEGMLASGAVLGGEQSGHVILTEHATTGDGILTAVKLLSFAAKRGTTIAELASVMRRYPQVMENVTVAHREKLDDADAVWEAVAEAEAALGNAGRVLVRASGTEPLVRVMVEAESEGDAAGLARAIAERVRSELG